MNVLDATEECAECWQQFYRDELYRLSWPDGMVQYVCLDCWEDMDSLPDDDDNWGWDDFC